MARAEFFGRLRKALGHGVADPGCHVGARARQHADDDADDIAANLRFHVLLGQVPLILENAAKTPEGQLRRLRRHHRAHHFRHGEDADERRDDLDAAKEIGDAEGESGSPGGIFDADAGNQQAEQHARDGLHR